jgi:hypothetical protein
MWLVTLPSASVINCCSSLQLLVISRHPNESSSPFAFLIVQDLSSSDYNISVHESEEDIVIITYYMHALERIHVHFWLTMESGKYESSVDFHQIHKASMTQILWIFTN